MNIADLRCRLRGAPTLVHWLTDEALVELLRSPSASPTLDQTLIAQAAWRARNSQEWAQHLSSQPWLDQDLRRDIEAWLLDPGRDFGPTPQGAIVELRSWYDDWERADGAILIAVMAVPGLDAAALPFELEERSPDKPRVVDSEGRALIGLAAALEGLGDEALRPNLRARLRWLPAQDGLQIEGRSASLSLALAFGSHFKVPRSVMASASIEGGRIAAIGEAGAKLAAARRAAAQLLVLPAGTGLRSESPSILEIPIGERASDVISQLYRRLEAQGLARPCLIELERSIQKAEQDLRSARRSPRLVLQELEGLAAALDQLSGLQREELVLMVTLQQMAALCHCGESAEALSMLEDLERRATALGRSDRLARAQAFAVVSLTDLGFFTPAVALARQALASLSRAEMSLSDRRRLEMELHGSLGQALCYAALLRHSSPEEALLELEAALACARDLQLPAEMARDANYLTLWAALHRPQELNQRIAVAAEAARLDPISEQFLRRILGLAAYMALLQGRLLPWDRALPDKGPAWLRATSLKYRAALAASEENYKMAQTDFSAASAILETERSPILRFIRATIAVEAWASLRGSLPTLAQKWQEEAQNMLGALDSQLPGNLVKNWRGFLNNGPDPRLEFPY